MVATIKELTDYTWYVGRKNSLMTGIDELIKKYSVSAFPRVSELLLLLKCLRSFGGGQFDYFLDGLKYDKFTPSVEFPVPSVLERILRQIAHDLEAVQRIADQRSILTPLGLRALKRGDLFAARLLESVTPLLRVAPGAGVPNQWTVITYFEKVVNVRVIPYANTILIGIPMTCLEGPRDYLAIPHELGHAVYWRRTTDLASTPVNRSYLPPKPPEPNPDPFKYFRHWQEELFADVVGAMLAGPAIALDFQELENGRIGEDFFKLDDDHPAPALRPVIYAKVARNWGAQATADKLLDRWRERVQAHIAEWTAAPLTVDQQTFIDLVTASDTELTVGHLPDDMIFQVLGKIPGIRGDWTGNLTAFNNALDTQGEDPYAAFTTMINALDSEAIPEVNFDSGFQPPDLWEAWLNQEFGSALTLGVPPAPLPAGELTSLSLKPENKWIQQWFAAGWTTEGPGGDPTRP